MPSPLPRPFRPALVAALAVGLAACAAPRPADPGAAPEPSPVASASSSSTSSASTSAARRPAGPVYTPGTNPDAEARLAAAVDQYQGADFEAAAAAFSAYADDAGNAGD